MVKLTKIYTRGGDKGETSLGDGTRRPKHAARVAAYGDVDETNAVIGLVRLHVSDEVAQALGHVQNDLFDLGADLCTPESPDPKVPPLRIVAGQVDWLEREIDRLNGEMAPLSSFILPGGSAASAYLHLARTVARRAERSMTLLGETENINSISISYINRLSDYLFVLGRYLNDKGRADILWVPGANRES